MTQDTGARVVRSPNGLLRSRSALSALALLLLACKPIVGVPPAPAPPAPALKTATDIWPSWSRDGEWILFLRRFPSQYGPAGLYRMRITSDTPEFLVPGTFTDPETPRYSPDGTKIVMGLNSQLAILDLGSRQILTPMYTDNGARFGDWASDGHRIVYSRIVRQFGEPPDSGGLHILNLASGVDLYIGNLFNGGESRWEPKGTRIACTRNSGSTGILALLDVERRTVDTLFSVAGHPFERPQWTENAVTGEPEIVVSSTTGRKSWRVSLTTRHAQSLDPPLNVYDAVSPNGQELIFLRAQQDSTAVLFHRRIIDPYGTSIRQITSWREP